MFVSFGKMLRHLEKSHLDSRTKLLGSAARLESNDDLGNVDDSCVIVIPVKEFRSLRGGSR